MVLLDILAWANFFSLNISAFLFGYLSILSVMPVTRSERKGKKAWKECKNLRLISSVFAFIMIGNNILWVWIPIPLLNWLTSSGKGPGLWLGLGGLSPPRLRKPYVN